MRARAIIYEVTGNMFFGTAWQLRPISANQTESERELYSSPFKLLTKLWSLLHGYGWPTVYKP